MSVNCSRSFIVRLGNGRVPSGAAENDENDGLNPVFIDAHGAVSMSLHDDFGFFYRLKATLFNRIIRI